MNEAEIQRDIMLAIGSRADCRIWRNNCGTAKSQSGRFVRFGLPGAADILGIVRVEHRAALAAVCRLAELLPPSSCEDLALVTAALAPVGRFLANEVKSETGRLSDEQRAFKNMVEAFGGLYVLSRSVADSVNALEAACR